MNEQLLEKAKTADSAEELLSMAKEEGINLTEAEAAAYFNQLNAAEGELADEELDNVAGGHTTDCSGNPDHNRGSVDCYKQIDFDDPACEKYSKCLKYQRNSKPGKRCGNCGYASLTVVDVNAGYHFCGKFFADGCEVPGAVYIR
jgi:predicted ribosomally synthesized peptide with nif11-like leader